MIRYTGNKEYIDKLKRETGKSKKELFQKLPYDKNYLYQIFKGSKTTTIKTALTISYLMNDDIKNLFKKMED